MRDLSLRSVTLSRFRSFVQPTTFRMDGPRGMRLVTGTNSAEPRLGANGVGKSTIFDAVCCCLFGTSVRGLRPSELVSWGCKDFELSVALLIDGAEHVVTRTCPPSRVRIDDEPAEQTDVDRLVGRSRSRFLNSVVYGQAVPLFLDLSVPARGELLDDVLDLEMWMRATKQAGDEHSARSADLNKLRVQLARVNGQLEGLPNLSDLRRLEHEWHDAQEARFVDLDTRLRAALHEHVAAQRAARGDIAEVDAASLQKVYDDAQKSRATAAEDRSGVRMQLRQVLDDLKFFAENALCPSCGQDIPEDTTYAHLESLEAKRAKLEADLEDFDAAIQLADDDLPKLRTAWQEAVRSNAAAQRERALLRSQIAEKQKAVERLEAERARLAEEANPYAEQRRTVAERRRVLRKELEEKIARETALLGEMASLEYWRGGFRKVRLFCLERVLGELEVEARNEFMELGLVGWGIGFKTATETKSGTVRLGVQAEIRSPDHLTPFDAMSPGEQQRARLGASLGLGSLIQRWSGTRWDVEVYDEPTNWLSEQGVEDLMETLTDRSTRQGKSIWVCDHRALASGGFVEVVQVVKDENGSRVER